jgi:hypothetical protein
MAQPRVPRGDGFEDIRRAVAVLDAGTVHHKPDQQTKRVGDDMALAPVDPFPCVIASDPATFCGFYALAIDNSGARLGVAPVGQPRGFDQLAVHLIEQTVIAPGMKIAPYRRNRRQIVGQHPPLAAGRRHVEDGVEHVAQACRAGSARGLGRGHERRNRRPFRIGQIACVFVALTGMLAHSG